MKNIHVKRYPLYLLRWQASTVILAPVIAMMPNSPIMSAIVGNLIGGLIFYWIDLKIFNKS